MEHVIVLQHIYSCIDDTLNHFLITRNDHILPVFLRFTFVIENQNIWRRHINLQCTLLVPLSYFLDPSHPVRHTGVPINHIHTYLWNRSFHICHFTIWSRYHWLFSFHRPKLLPNDECRRALQWQLCHVCMPYNALHFQLKPLRLRRAVVPVRGHLCTLGFHASRFKSCIPHKSHPTCARLISLWIYCTPIFWYLNTACRHNFLFLDSTHVLLRPLKFLAALRNFSNRHITPLFYLNETNFYVGETLVLFFIYCLKFGDFPTTHHRRFVEEACNHLTQLQLCLFSH